MISRFLPLFFVASISVSAETLTFEQALEQILQRHTDLKTQEAKAEAVEAQNLPKKLMYLPTVSFQGSRVTGKDPGASDITTWGIAGVAEMNLIRFGADLAAWSAATADEHAQEATTRAVRLRAEDEAVKALAAMIQKSQEQSVLEKIVNVQAELAKIAQQRFARGFLPRQEVDKVTVDLDNARARLQNSEVTKTQAHANLTRLLGMANVVLQWPWRERLLKMRQGISATQNSPVVFSVQAHPEWQAAQAAVDAQEQRRERAWRLMFPSIDGKFSYGYGDPTGSYSGTQWAGLLTLSVPLFDRLANYSSFRAESLGVTEAELKREEAKRSAEAEWEVARKSFETSLNSILLRERTLDSSRRLYEDNLKRFRAGRINANDFVIDQNRLHESELLSIEGWAATHVAYGRWCHARGLTLAECH